MSTTTIQMVPDYLLSTEKGGIDVVVEFPDGSVTVGMVASEKALDVLHGWTIAKDAVLTSFPNGVDALRFALNVD